MNIKSKKCYICKAYGGITNTIEDADLGDNLNFIKLSCCGYFKIVFVMFLMKVACYKLNFTKK